TAVTRRLQEPVSCRFSTPRGLECSTVLAPEGSAHDVDEAGDGHSGQCPGGGEAAPDPSQLGAGDGRGLPVVEEGVVPDLAGEDQRQIFRMGGGEDAAVAAGDDEQAGSLPSGHAVPVVEFPPGSGVDRRGDPGDEGFEHGRGQAAVVEATQGWNESREEGDLAL